MILSRFVRLFLLNLPCTDKDDTAESRQYHPLQIAFSRFDVDGDGELERAEVQVRRKCMVHGLSLIHI